MTTGQELVPVDARPEPSAVVLWGTNEPAGMVARMGVISSALEGAIRDRRMFKKIGDRDYVFVDGWAMCGAMLGIFPRTAALDEMRDDDGQMFGFRANVELVTRDGGVVGGAVAICTRNEERWADRDWNQIASMAQTRATGKAYRATLGFVMQMAGYASTPAEEMDGVVPEERADRATRPATTAPASPDWWTRLNVLARERGVTIGQMAEVAVVEPPETAKDAITRWLNENSNASEGDAGLAKLIDRAAFIPAVR